MNICLCLEQNSRDYRSSFCQDHWFSIAITVASCAALIIAALMRAKVGVLDLNSSWSKIGGDWLIPLAVISLLGILYLGYKKYYYNELPQVPTVSSIPSPQPPILPSIEPKRVSLAQPQHSKFVIPASATADGFIEEQEMEIGLAPNAPSLPINPTPIPIPPSTTLSIPIVQDIPPPPINFVVIEKDKQTFNQLVEDHNQIPSDSSPVAILFSGGTASGKTSIR